MSTFAASHLSPSYPDRAAWGTAPKLRAWQQEAFDLYFRREPRDFLTVATPGAGKTTYALRIASELLANGVIRSITIVTPTEHLKRQWADAAARVGIGIDPEFKNSQGTTSRDYTGVAVTYAQVAMHPALHRARTEARKTLVIFDEIHHAGDAKSWGDGVSEAFEPATRRLQLTGTPFRSDDNPIPFVAYEEDAEGLKRSVADYSYGYGPALDDGVVRPVIFLAYSGEMKWRTRAGDEIAATLGTPLTKDQLSQAWRAALDPKGDWIRQVMQAADRRLTEVRRGVPDAGGLVIATDHETARAYARHLRNITGEGATVVLSDDPGASKKIKQFAASPDRWLVAVRMVSEGVDIPRLCVGVYATSTSTPLFFAQAVGRFVRARKRGETASVFLPSVPTLMGLANEMEVERDHVLNKRPPEDGLDDSLLEQANRQKDNPDVLGDELPFETMETSATFDRVLFDGGEFGTGAAVGSAEEEDFLGLPGLLEPDQVATLLRKRQSDQQAARRKQAEEQPAETLAPHEQIAELRRELNGLVGAWNHRTGQPHGVIHSELRRSCGGPPIAQATAEQIQERIATIRRWATQRR
ncbi:DEAD/DEAH box helicase [Nonomuraea angiospora]|uniref:Superfamily II DNA or RNA helicase n=1 Tax=Nonomuraea angiospora TaxID=46172 RepID=A0ABR9ME77_9ACTN|nr:DEAD/DEAH box helicase [Nonomuraea angiospora]MBE1590802.1 superfamily II DNA or RNA helicase [Nonomuraea angiospora]MDX3110527.1 DEAD/DEAH box helicase [Nonomuraea angiospora]